MTIYDIIYAMEKDFNTQKTAENSALNETVKPESESPSTYPNTPERVRIEFEIYAKDEPQLKRMIEIAYLAKLIPAPDILYFIPFCINCGAAYLEEIAKPQ